MTEPIDRAFVEVSPDLDKFLTALRKDLNAAFKRAAKDVDRHTDDMEKDFKQTSKVMKTEVTKVGKSIDKTFADTKKSIAEHWKEALATLTLGPQVSLIIRQLRANLIVALGGLALAAAQALGEALIPLTATFASALAFIPGVIAGVVASMLVLKAATKGVGDALKFAGEKDAEKFNEALKELSPNARAFAREIRKLIFGLKPLQKQLQDTFFAGLDTNIALIGDVIKALKPAILGVGAAFNGIVRDITRFGGSLTALTAGRAILEGIKEFLVGIRPAITPLLTAFANLAKQAAAFFGPLGKSLGRLGVQFAEFLEGIDLGEVLRNISDAISLLMPVFKVLKVVFESLNEVATIFRPALNALVPAFAALGKVLVNFVRGLGPGLEVFITALGDALLALVPVAEPVGRAISSIAEAIAPIIATLGPELAIVLSLVATAVESIMTLMAPFISTWAQIAQQFAARVLPIVLRLGETVLPLVAAAAERILGALAPLIPVLVRIGGEFLTRFGPALLQIAETMITQLLPPFVEFVEAIMPALLEVLEQLEPHIPALTEAFILIAKAVAELAVAAAPLLPLLGQIVAVFLQLSTIIFGAVVGSINALMQTWNVLTSSTGPNVKSMFSSVGASAVTAARNFTKFRNTVANVSSMVLSSISSMANQIMSRLRGLGSLMGGVGRDLINGLISGIRSMASAAARAAVDAVRSAIDAAKSFLQIGSPSKLARDEIGTPVGQGIQAGFKRTENDVASALADLSFPAPAPATTPPSEVRTTTPELDLRALARELVRALNGMEWQFVDVDKVVSRAQGQRAQRLSRA